MFTHLLLLTAVAVGGALGVDKCPIFQTTDPNTPCYLEVARTEDGAPVPPFVYAFSLPPPSPRQPCPVLQSQDPAQRCYFPAPGPAFRLLSSLPKDADRIDESLYVTKRPDQLSFPNPIIRIDPDGYTSHGRVWEFDVP